MARSSARTDACSSDACMRGRDVGNKKRRLMQEERNPSRCWAHMLKRIKRREKGGKQIPQGGQRASAWMQKLQFGVWGRSEQIAGDEWISGRMKRREIRGGGSDKRDARKWALSQKEGNGGEMIQLLAESETPVWKIMSSITAGWSADVAFREHNGF